MNTMSNSEGIYTNIGSMVKRRVESFEQSTYLTSPPNQETQQLEWHEVQRSNLPIGRGTFCMVFKARHNNKIMALKCLSNRIELNTKSYVTGSTDLCLEAKILEKLNHKNIVRLHATKKGCIEESVNKRDYFVLIDHLVETLDDRLYKWRASNNRCGLKLLLVGGKKNYKRKKELHRVEQAALGIAKGMEYMHSKGIIFRDLKPENVGFDKKGTAKIFDFGIARDMRAVEEAGTKLGFAGTPKYMANEIGDGKAYDISADVYSFGVLLWEICTLRNPFERICSVDEYKRHIVAGHHRPEIKAVSNKDLQTLIQSCWHFNPKCRPTMQEVCRQLHRICGIIYVESVEGRPRNRFAAKRTLSETTSRTISCSSLLVEEMYIQQNPLHT